MKFNSRNPVGTALSLGSNIAVAAEAQRAKERMRSALLAVDVPATVLNQTYTSSAQALGARKVFARSRATYLLDIEIREYGIHASSPNGAVSMVMRLTARLYDSANRELLWRRNVTIDQQASPYMFGFGSVIGNVVTAGTLANLTTAEMERGFSQLARESSLSLARKLERDLYSARYR